MSRSNQKYFNRSIIVAALVLITHVGVLTAFDIKSQAQDDAKIESIELKLGQLEVELVGVRAASEETVAALEDRVEELEETNMEVREYEMHLEMRQLQGITDTLEYFLAYKDIIERYPEYNQDIETLYDKFTEREIFYLESMVEVETHGADFESKTHVANVALNRLESPLFPNNLIAVITSPSQFAYGATNISETTKLACEYAVMFPDNTDGAIAFHSGPVTPTFWGRELIFTDDVHHSFYK